MKPTIVGVCRKCDYKADIILFNHNFADYQCPKCGGYKVHVIIYETEEPEEEDDDGN